VPARSGPEQRGRCSSGCAGPEDVETPTAGRWPAAKTRRASGSQLVRPPTPPFGRFARERRAKRRRRRSACRRPVGPVRSPRGPVHKTPGLARGVPWCPSSHSNRRSGVPSTGRIRSSRTRVCRPSPLDHNKTKTRPKKPKKKNGDGSGADGRFVHADHSPGPLKHMPRILPR